MKKISILLFFTFFLRCFLFAQVDTVNTKNNKLLLTNLHESKAAYLVYIADSATGEIHYSDIWERGVSFTSFHGTPAVNYNWKWYHHDSLYKAVSDMCDRATLAPLYAYTNSKRAGIMAYNFDNGYMVIADTVAGNNAKPGTKIAMEVPTFDWQWDMELFELLPYKKAGQQFAIAFYDPNDLNGKPQYYMHTVIGEDNLVLNKEAQVKCWLLRVDYNKETYAIFWISEKSHEMLKMKNYYKGMFRYKVRLY